MIKFHQKIALCVIALLPAVMLQAQGELPGANGQRGAKNESVAEGDVVLANWMLVGSNNEVALANLAKSQASNNDVKQFAKKMVEEHGQIALKLQPYAGAPATTVSVKERIPMKDDSSRRPADASGVPAEHAFDHTALIRDLGAKCLASETKTLNEKTGPEFDLGFMRMQVAAHTRALIMCEVFGTYASSSLRATLEQGQTKLQAHLDEAKTLCTQLEKAEKVAKIGNDNR